MDALVFIQEEVEDYFAERCSDRLRSVSCLSLSMYLVLNC